MKESGRHFTTVSTRNEYRVVHCVVVLDGADRKTVHVHERVW